MRVGHGRAALPVPDGTPLGGYADRDGPSAGVLDEIGVDCVSWAGGRRRLLLVVAELLCVNDDLAAAVRSSVRDAVDGAAEVWVCATHTHGAPDVGYVPGGGVTPAAVRDAVAAAATTAARAAVAGEQPCAGRLHSGVLRDVGGPRGAAPGDPLVGVDAVACVSSDGDVLGVLIPLPIHPTVLPATSRLVSGDLAGTVRRALADRLTAAWIVVAHGAAGDVSTRRTRREQTPAEVVRLGALAADQLAAIVAGAPGEPLWGPDDGQIATTQTTISLPARRREPAELARLRAELDAERRARLARGDRIAARIAETGLQGVAVAEASAARGVDRIGVRLSAATLGRLTLLGIGGEPFHGLRTAVRQRCGPATTVLACANGHMGYVPDEAALTTPGYEALASPLAPGAPTAIAASLINLRPDPERTP